MYNAQTRSWLGPCADIEGPMNVIVYMYIVLIFEIISTLIITTLHVRSRQLVILTDRIICMAACITSIILPEITQLCVASHDFVILIHSELLTLKLNS